MEYPQSHTPSFSHEINHYLTMIYSQLQHIEYLYKYLSKDSHWIQMKEDFSSVFDLLEQTMETEDLICASLESTPLSLFLQRLYQSWHPRLSDHGIDFWLPSTIEEVEIPISETQLERIFCNILSNSFDAICQKTSYSRRPDFISIETELHSKNLQIKVTDSGCGMNPHQLEQVLSPGVTYKEHGHGLGLSLVLEIMSSINGTLRIVSSPRRGTSVILNFPL